MKITLCVLVFLGACSLGAQPVASKDAVSRFVTSVDKHIGNFTQLEARYEETIAPIVPWFASNVTDEEIAAQTDIIHHIRRLLPKIVFAPEGKLNHTIMRNGAVFTHRVAQKIGTETGDFTLAGDGKLFFSLDNKLHRATLSEKYPHCGSDLFELLVKVRTDRIERGRHALEQVKDMIFSSTQPPVVESDVSSGTQLITKVRIPLENPSGYERLLTYHWDASSGNLLQLTQSLLQNGTGRSIEYYRVEFEQHGAFQAIPGLPAKIKITELVECSLPFEEFERLKGQGKIKIFRASLKKLEKEIVVTHGEKGVSASEIADLIKIPKDYLMLDLLSKGAAKTNQDQFPFRTVKK
jgi:hypothetical protein